MKSSRPRQPYGSPLRASVESSPFGVGVSHFGGVGVRVRGMTGLGARRLPVGGLQHRRHLRTGKKSLRQQPDPIQPIRLRRLIPPTHRPRRITSRLDPRRRQLPRPSTFRQRHCLHRRSSHPRRRHPDRRRPSVNPHDQNSAFGASQAMFEYIEAFYNPESSQISMNHMSPTA